MTIFTQRMLERIEYSVNQSTQHQVHPQSYSTHYQSQEEQDQNVLLSAVNICPATAIVTNSTTTTSSSSTSSLGTGHTTNSEEILGVILPETIRLIDGEELLDTAMSVITSDVRTY